MQQSSYNAWGGGGGGHLSAQSGLVKRKCLATISHGKCYSCLKLVGCGDNLTG